MENRMTDEERFRMHEGAMQAPCRPRGDRRRARQPEHEPPAWVGWLMIACVLALGLIGGYLVSALV